MDGAIGRGACALKEESEEIRGKPGCCAGAGYGKETGGRGGGPLGRVAGREGKGIVRSEAAWRGRADVKAIYH